MKFKGSATILIFFIVGVTATSAQQIQNLKASVEGERIFITFDLITDSAGDKFDVAVYASNNNFNSPLRLVSGDIGSSVEAGTAKRIVWSARTELGNFKGDLSFELRATVVAVFSQTSKLAAVKRGTSVPLGWHGGKKDEDVKIELLKAGTSVRTLSSSGNNGKYDWSIPGDQKPGKDYQIRMTNGREISTSNNFQIKHKIPTLLKVAPVVVVAGVLVAISSGSKSSETPKDSSLPAPPDLGLN